MGHGNEWHQPATLPIVRESIVIYTLSGRIGKVVASHAAVARSIPGEVVLIYTMHVAHRGYYP